MGGHPPRWTRRLLTPNGESKTSRGEIWLARLDPTRGRELAGIQPVLVVSNDRLNHGPQRLTVIVPLTTRDRGMSLHVAFDPPEGGLAERSFALCEAVRSISTERLVRRFGAVSPHGLDAVEDRLRVLFEL